MIEGKHSITWDGKDDNGNKIAKGIYYYRFKSGKKLFTRKIIII